jgi:hypothetical protein
VNRKIGISLAVLAAILLSLGTFSRSWWAGSGKQKTTIGLRSGHMCLGEQCARVRLASLVTEDQGWLRATATAYGAGLIAVGLLMAAAVLRIRYPTEARVIPAVATVGSIVALAAALLALRSFPGMEGVGVSYGVGLYVVGAVAGGTAGILLLRQ